MFGAALGLWLWPAIAGGQPQSEGRQRPSIHPTIELRNLAPGVRIDWRKRQIEVDGRIVLRKGPLELLACRPKTREHESILAIEAHAMHVFWAMGLVGLEPGSPARYDEKDDRWHPPHGEALVLRVRFRRGDKSHTVPVERWLREVETHRSPERINWVFAGSRTFESGRFGADIEGTVVCVVDFDTALIAIGSLHSADNELLWLEANTEAIPPLDTPCTLLIRSALVRTITVEVTAEGAIRHAGTLLSAADLAMTLRGEKKGGHSAGVRIVLRVGEKTTNASVEAVVAALVKAGVDRSLVEVRRIASEPGRKSPRERPGSG